jgi:hypothetical protein
MIELVIFIGIGVLLVIIGIVLLTGRGSFLIAGYNTMPKEKKANYDARALCKFLGKIITPIGILLFGFLIEGIQGWFTWVFLAVAIALLIFALIYANKGNRFKK